MSTLTRAPMTPRLVRRRYSKGLVLLTVWRNGYKNRGMWATSKNTTLIITTKGSQSVRVMSQVGSLSELSEELEWA